MAFGTPEEIRAWAFERLQTSGLVASLALEDVIASADTLAGWVMSGTPPADQMRPEFVVLHDRLNEIEGAVERAVRSASKKLRAEMAAGFARLHGHINLEGAADMVKHVDITDALTNLENVQAAHILYTQNQAAQLLEALDNGSEDEMRAVIERMKTMAAKSAAAIVAGTPAASEPTPVVDETAGTVTVETPAGPVVTEVATGETVEPPAAEAGGEPAPDAPAAQ